MIGKMDMPPGFRYRDVFYKGKPCHNRYDYFLAKHPRMDIGRRAKIFSPFDALKGFSEAVAAKEELYVSRKELNEEDKAELDRRVGILKNFTKNSRMARENKILATITYFVPCADPDSSSYGCKGQYKTISGIVFKVDTDASRSILIGTALIPFADIMSIEADTIFDEM